MGGIGGARGIIGILLASGVVALPIGLVAADTIAKTWSDFGTTPGRTATVAVVWILALLWGFSGMRPGR